MNRSQPTQIKALHGKPGRRPLNAREPQPTGDLTEAPAWFTDEQRAGWDYAIENAPAGLLRLLDRSALAAFVVAEDLHRQACIMQRKVGLVGRIGPEPKRSEPDNRPIIQSPYLPIINKQAALMLKAAAELGFTPSSRSRIVVEAEAMSVLGRVRPMRPGAAPSVGIDEYVRSAPEVPRLH